MSGFRLGVIASAIRTLIGQIVEEIDVHFSSVSLLLHMTGAHSSTYFADSSPTPKVVTPTGGTVISTTHSKFSPSSGFFDGTNDYLSAPTGVAFQFPGDFTVEMWVRSNTITGGVGRCLFDCRSSAASATGFVLFMFNAGVNVFSNNANRISAPNLSVVLNQWTHIALCRTGTAMTLWVDGQQSGATYTIATNFSDGLCVIGRDNPGASQYFSGYMDEVRITKGVGRYTKAFTPPSKAFYDNVSASYTANLSLLMHCNGLHNGTIFLDSSPSNKTISVGGGTPLISSTVKKFGTASLYLDGTGDFLTTPDSADLDFGSGDFTIEVWAYYTSGYPAIYGGILDHWENPSNCGWWMGLDSAGKFAFFYSLSGSDSFHTQTTVSVPLNVWVHLAVVRRGPTITLYKGGVADGTLSVGTSSLFSATCGLGIGASAGGLSVSTSGYFEEFRITKGAARYTTNFNAPGSAFLDNRKDAYPEHTVLLLRGEGTHLAQVFTDSSLFANTATASAGTVNTNTGQFKFGSSSMFFNGGRVYFADSDLWWMDALDFTIECWVYRTVTSANRLAIFAQEQSGGGDGSVLLEHNTSGIIRGAVSIAGTSYAVAALSAIATNTWYHVALVRRSTTLYLFLNGTLQATLTIPSGAVPNVTHKIAVGGYGEYEGASGGGFGTNWLGYIDDFRITKGIARYTRSFVAPYVTLPALTDTKTDPYIDDTVAMLHMNGADLSTVLTDNSLAARTVTVVGNAKISTATSALGGSSLTLDGTGDYLTMADSVDFAFGSLDFTIECWVYPTSMPGAGVNRGLFCKSLSATQKAFVAYISPSTSYLNVQVYENNTTSVSLTSSAIPFTINTWAHVALVRSGSVLLLFIDGVLAGQVAITFAIQASTAVFDIGTLYSGSGVTNSYWFGNIDEFRVTKGVARYTKSFTPSLAEFPHV